MSSKRALHWVFKVGNRKETIKFYKDILGMKILRHEEFEKGCEAMCNGPYDGKWSKTMVGYGPENNHFVVELTYNYNISSYKLGNDFQGITIQSGEALARAKEAGCQIKDEDGKMAVRDPGGYKFFLVDSPQPKERDPVVGVSMGVSQLPASLHYWTMLLGMQKLEESDDSATLSYGDNQAKLTLKTVGSVDHAKAYGRIAFSITADELAPLEKVMKEAKTKILTPLVSLDTPGKATVQVVILADPDDHEICFVGDEAFRELSQVDPKANDLLEAAIEADKSDAWFEKKGKEKVVEI